MFVCVLLLFSCQKQQINLFIFGVIEKDSRSYNLLQNFLLWCLPFTLAVVYPKTGSLFALLASFGSLFVVYTFPTLVYLKFKKTQLMNPMLAEALNENRFSLKAGPDLLEEADLLPSAGPRIVVRDSFLAEQKREGFGFGQK
mmetsp:Transcript_7163/g.5419  ORF Transcript_7163/g.5419 Transcript_7163/m.5419 type:complete len:142 (-) Transcript_7163:128-553(-)